MSQSIDIPKVDEFLQELAAIQQTGGKRIAILGSRHVPITHQHLIEMMTYALVLEGNRLITSGATGTNLAALRGALRADASLLTVILPQSLERQPRESREQLQATAATQVADVLSGRRPNNVVNPEALDTRAARVVFA